MTKYIRYSSSYVVYDKTNYKYLYFASYIIKQMELNGHLDHVFRQIFQHAYV